jgi:D-alanine-D-alanine ligase
VAVVFGGRSTEHAVSCASAGLVLSAIDRDRYDVLPVGIATDGRWVLTSGDPARLALSSSSAPSVEAVALPGSEITPRGGSLQVSAPGEVPRDLGAVDVVLPLLHGTYGEDGTIQGLLEMTGTRYAGAGVFASAAGMDKEYMKLIIAARGLPAGRYVVVRDRDWSGGAGGPGERKRVLDEIAELGWPVFVKPARGGSSVGITRVTGAAELESAVEAARAHDPKVLVEAAVAGMEVECAVLEGLDGGPPEASVPGQVVVDPGSSFYDFRAKYLAAGTTMRIPAPIPAAAAAEVRRLACAAFEAISCEGLARVDFFYTPAGQVLFNEINTMPGMTPASGFPLMWAATGLPLPQLIDRIIQTALRKRPGPRLPGRRRWLPLAVALIPRVMVLLPAEEAPGQQAEHQRVRGQDQKRRRRGELPLHRVLHRLHRRAERGVAADVPEHPGHELSRPPQAGEEDHREERQPADDAGAGGGLGHRGDQQPHREQRGGGQRDRCHERAGALRGLRPVDGDARDQEDEDPGQRQAQLDDPLGGQQPGRGNRGGRQAAQHPQLAVAGQRHRQAEQGQQGQAHHDQDRHVHIERGEPAQVRGGLAERGYQAEDHQQHHRDGSAADQAGRLPPGEPGLVEHDLPEGGTPGRPRPRPGQCSHDVSPCSWFPVSLTKASSRLAESSRTSRAVTPAVARARITVLTSSPVPVTVTC